MKFEENGWIFFVLIWRYCLKNIVISYGYEFIFGDRLRDWKKEERKKEEKKTGADFDVTGERCLPGHRWTLAICSPLFSMERHCVVEVVEVVESVEVDRQNTPIGFPIPRFVIHGFVIHGFVELDGVEIPQIVRPVLVDV